MTADPKETEETEVPLADDHAESAGNAERGMDVISAFVRTLPNKPGVYRMLNEAGDVLYVGKARNLKKQVLSYARLTGHTSRIARMILQTASMEFITTGSDR